MLSLPLSDTAHPCPSPPRRLDGDRDTFYPSQLLWLELQAPWKEDQTHKTNLLRGSMQVLARSHRAGTSTRPLAAGAQQIHRLGWEQAGGARAHATPSALGTGSGARCQQGRHTDIICTSPAACQVRGASQAPRARHRDGGHSPITELDFKELWVHPPCLDAAPPHQLQ